MTTLHTLTCRDVNGILVNVEKMGYFNFFGTIKK